MKVTEIGNKLLESGQMFFPSNERVDSKKQVLLVMPKVPYAINDWNIPPIGILYVSSYMKKMGISVHCLNLCISENEPMDELKQTIREKQINIVATGDLVVNYLAVKEIVDCAKEVSPNIITIIGGGLVTHSPVEAMQLIPNADYGVIGEGELTDSELVLALEEGRNVSEVEGIIYRQGGKLCKSMPREVIADLDSLPWPDYEGFNYFEIARRHSDNGKITAPLTTSRSCPFQCTFCSTSGGGKYRQRSIDSIFEELQYVVKNYHVEEVFLNDELFAVDGERVSEFCQRIESIHVKWHVMLRIGKHIQLSLLRKMYNAGCVGVCYGLESADDSILLSMKKTGVTQKEMKRVLEITKEAGLMVRGGFIFGDTQETLETAEYTMKWVEEHIDLLENVSISPIVLYPGSTLYERAVQSKKISDTVQFIKEHCPLVNSSEKMSDKDYQELVNDKIPAFAARYRTKIAIRHREIFGEKITPEKQNGRYRHDFQCNQCGNHIMEYIHPTGMFQHHTQCPYCGKRYDLFPGLIMLQQYEEAFSRILGREDCAIWGMGESAQDVYYNNSFFQDAEKILLIDSNIEKQKAGFHEKSVMGPEILQKAKCKILLCFTGNSNFQSICKELAGTNIGIFKVIWLYDILLEVSDVLDE